jgi:hypothetical protein
MQANHWRLIRIKGLWYDRRIGALVQVGWNCRHDEGASLIEAVGLGVVKLLIVLDVF